MESEQVIPARSRLEAMDWSLVLISQGIESTILRSLEDQGWGVSVSPVYYQAAVEAIGLYRAENRSWGLRREVFQPGLLFDWVSIVWVGLVCALHLINATILDLRTPGIVDTVAISHGQWWRLFTAIWLHADAGHLASNAVFGFVLLGLAMGRYGSGVGLLAAYLAGVAGNLLSWACATNPHDGLGASGMVMGCLGLLAVQSVSLWRKTRHDGKHFLSGLFAGVMLFILLGFTPGTDVLAHFGGFAAGLVFGGLLVRPAVYLRKPYLNFSSAMIFLLLVLWPWWLAFHGVSSA